MKFTATQKDLALLAASISGVVQKKNTSTILNNIKLSVKDDVLSGQGTDLEMEVLFSIDVESLDDGEITVPAEKFKKLVNAMPKTLPVQCSLDGERFIIESGRGKYELTTLPSQDYPSLDDLAFDLPIDIEESQFVNLLSSVSHSMADGDVRYYLNSALLSVKDGQLRSISTDGHRLTLNSIDHQAASDINIIVPRKAVLELQKLLSNKSDEVITVKMSRNHIQVKSHDLVISSKLIDGKYPAWEAAIPSNINFSVDLDTAQLKSALQRVSVLANEKFKGCRLKLTNGLLTISSNNPEQESAREEIEVNYSGDEFEIGFNIDYVIAALGGSEITKFSFTTSTASCLVTDDTTTQHVLMPVRL